MITATTTIQIFTCLMLFIHCMILLQRYEYVSEMQKKSVFFFSFLGFSIVLRTFVPI